MSYKLNQKGFSIVEGLLSLIVVLLIVFVGYYVYHTQRTTNSTYNAATKVAQSSSPSSASKYLSVKELGVKFKLSDTIATAYYTKSSDGYYYFSVHSFDNKAGLSQCTQVVALITGKPGESNGTPAGGTWTTDTLKNAGLKQVGDTYYGFQKGQIICWDVNAADASASETKVNDVIQAFVAATPTFTKE